jgi:uncharacterized protein with GYD domain
MAAYIATVKFTQQGMAGIHETCERAEAVKAFGKKIGVKVTSVFWTLGPFDGVLLFEAPDEETATAFTLHIVSLGNVKTQTARCFSAAEMKKVLALSTK